MKKKSIGSIIWAAAAFVIIILDFAVKRHIFNTVNVGEVFGEIPGICDFIYVKNTGAAFSMFSNNTLILGIISIVFCIAVVIYWFVRKKTHFMLNLACTLLFAGALGNAIDRVVYKFVVDFISLKWFNFPVFNVADISIVAGAIAAVIYVIFYDKDEKKGQING